ncbi:tubulin-tyrosine ligase family protein [Nitzschia inconspicua]|uniref:Tubulin-tyrosine ligase family protein n=1 Tax=Nitzschia inconspicua TaxID=303405 RepID=A0A9K3LPK1_9STRA|nr:tubulin-tyrosine ligase family protein [Nitzschia inconspicua]
MSIPTTRRRAAFLNNSNNASSAGSRGAQYEDTNDDRDGEFYTQHHHGDVVKPIFVGKISTFANRYTPPLIARYINPTALVILVAMLISHVTIGLAVYLYAKNGSFFCPVDLVEYINWSGSTALYQGALSFRSKGPYAYDSLVRIQPSSVPKKMEPVPESHRKTFYYDGDKITQPIARAYRSRGWTQVDKPQQAQWIYTYNTNRPWGEKLKPWQRFNMLPFYQKWNTKDQFTYYYKQFQRAHPERAPSQYVPETFMLSETVEDIMEFQKKLESGGYKYPWVLKAGSVNQGRGITMIAPSSKELVELPKKALYMLQKQADGGDAEEDEDWEDMIVQSYVCNEMTWERRKFDVRMYWLVASLDPLIVLYHDGYVRIGNSDYSEEDFSNTRAHLTTHTFLGAEGKATFDQFEEMITTYWESKNNRMGGTIGRSYPWPAKSPVEHVRNQFKDAIAEMIEVYQKEAFDIPDGQTITAENAFSFYCADFILDNDLDVWFIEPQNGCGLDEDYYFRLEMHGSLFNGMTDIMEEIWHKQEQGLPVMPIQNVGNWQILYGDGLIYRYEGYQRSHNKASCSATAKKKRVKK